ncbi:MAG: 6-phosphogluconolactonase [Prevotellaceae bacterium]|jgi:glucosamine-6-phosphate deaminase|nr:6-phosphogluconolactonase [Prevotellaceae bacterium]
MYTRYKLPKEGGLISDATPSDILQRYEKIRTGIYESEYDGVQYLSNAIVSTINSHSDKEKGKDKPAPFVLGLSTGRTPIGLYRELVKRYQKGEVSFENVVVYSLDELYPIKATEQQSRNYRIHEDFLSHVNVRPENIHIFDGTTPIETVSEYCKQFESNIHKIDLMIMGMGEQGQIGFNEPGSYAKSRTRLVQLNHATRESLQPLFHSYSSIPALAITMGMGTIMNARRIFLLAWGESKASIVRKVVEGEVTDQLPASLLQNHPNIEMVVDETAAEQLTREQTPWLVGPCEWTKKFTRKAVVWLCGEAKKPILKLTYQDYIENSLGPLLESAGPYDMINIGIFNDLQHTITGWPGGKPNADDVTRPVRSAPFPKRVLIFSPHPDDDVISMGGTFLRLVDQGHDVHVAYQTSGNFAVHDDVVLQIMDTARELKLDNKFEQVKKIIADKKAGEPEPRELRDIKAAIRRAEAKAASRLFGLNEETHAHFLNLPFYETGGIKKGVLQQEDIDIVVRLLNELKPHQIYAAGDLSDPHGTHRICIEAVLAAMQAVKREEWAKDVQMWLYRGAWQEWDLGVVDMAVPLSPEEMVKKRHAIYRHLSQKDIVPFPGSDTREFWQRAEDRTQNTAHLYDKLGMAEYQAIEVFVRIEI